MHVCAPCIDLRKDQQGKFRDCLSVGSSRQHAPRQVDMGNQANDVPSLYQADKTGVWFRGRQKVNRTGLDQFD